MFDVTCLDSYGEVVTNLTQWDIDQSLIIKDTGLKQAPLFHFCNKKSEEALVVTSTIEDGIITVKIPNSLLQESYTIFAYMYVYSSDTSGKTLATIKIPVRDRVKPSEYKYVENIDVVSAEIIKQNILDIIDNFENSLDVKIDEINTSFENYTLEVDEKIQLFVQENEADRQNWEEEQQKKYDEFVTKVSDGSPKGVFSEITDLVGKDMGAYINSTDGYLYYWDGYVLSDPICQYQSTGIADGTITYEMLADALKTAAIEDNRIFDTMDAVNEYIVSGSAKAGQIIKVLDSNNQNIYQVYILQSDASSETGLLLSPINAEPSATDVSYANRIDDSLKTVDDALNKIFDFYSSIGVKLNFDQETSELSLYNYLEAQLGDAVKIVSGVSGVSVDTVSEEDEDGNIVYYLVIYDADGVELTRCVLPATGGGGGGSSYLVRLINLMGSLRYTVASGQEHSIGVLYMETLGSETTDVEGTLELSYKLSSDSDYTTIGTYNVPCAASKDDLSNAFYIDVTPYLTAGEVINFRLVVTGGESAQTKSIVYTITCAELNISTTTSFDKAFTSNFSFLYKCLGRGISKTVYFYIDDVLYATNNVGTSHNTQLSQTINLTSDFDYGAHDLKVYFVTEEGTMSNVLNHSIIYDDGSSANPIIAVTNDSETVVYGDSINVDYVVYTPNKETTDELNIRLYTIETNGTQREYASSSMINIVNEVTNTWICNTYPNRGTVYIEFSSGETVKTINKTVLESSSEYNIETVTTNLVFSFSPAGKSNNDVGKENVSYDYTDVNNVKTTIECMFDNMNWVSDGYVSTDYGTALRLTSDDVMTINLPIFSSYYTDSNGKTIRFNGTPTSIGRTIEITLNMHEVTNRNVDVLSCMSDNHAGIKITPQSVCLLSSTGSNINTDETGFITNEESICCAYVKDEKKLRISFVLSSVSDDNKQCLVIYINGEVANSVPYDAEENFIQNLPIKIGNPACITDIYDIKIYDRELSESEIRTNWYASQDTISERIDAYEYNDVLDDRDDISYQKARLKYPCLLFIGTLSPYKGAKTKGAWILTKPDGNGGYTTEFSLTDKLNGEYVCTSNVQGTSSQKFMIKNFKAALAKLNEAGTGTTKVKYSIKPNSSIGESTLCWKADYMSTDHANTFNANLADEIMTSVSPTDVQNENPDVQNAVNGFRCLLFNQINDSSSIEFAGDGCLNNDKGNSKTFGLEVDTDSGNVTKRQKFEFLNNTADICHFKTDKFQHVTDGTADVYNALESTYPDQGDLEDEGLTPNWDHIQLLFSWVCQRANFCDADGTTVVRNTYNGTTYTTERDYKKAIFMNEFSKHFNKDHAIIYYLFIEFVALVDNRAKNMFIQCDDVTVEKLVNKSGQTININDCIDSDGNVDISSIDWDNSTFAKWKVVLYDLDSCYSAENNGYLRVPYYADWDYELNGTRQFNGYDSRLWLMVEEAFPSDIKTMAQNLASRELLCYDKFYDAHIKNNADLMCPTIVNKDMVYKYEAPWTDGYYDYSVSTTNPTWVQTNMYKYLHRGQRTAQKEAYIYNRSHMLYSKYVTTQFVRNQITFRVGASTGVSVDDADLTLTSNIALFIGVGYGDTGNGESITNGKIMPNTPTTLHASTRVGRSDTIYLYSGTDLIDIGDISVFQPYEIQLQRAIKMKNLKIGDISITNNSLSSLDLSNCVLLQNLNVCGCVSLVGTLDVSYNGLIEIIDARNSGINFVKLPTGGNLKELYLPTMRTISILNHVNLEKFDCQNYDSLTQLRVENTPNVPVDEILLNHMSQLVDGIRLVNVQLDLDDSKLLNLLVSDYAKGKYITSDGVLSEDKEAYPYISGTVNITRINQNLLNSLNEKYPYLTINYSIITHTVRFYSDINIVFDTQEVDDGTAATTPVGTPQKMNTARFKYTFVNWDTSYLNITRDLDILANYSSELQKYKVAFYKTSSDTTAIHEITDVEYGSSIDYVYEDTSSTDKVQVGWVDKNGVVFEYNITLDDTICSVNNLGNPETVVFYIYYQDIAMPTKSVSSLSELNYGEIKAVSNMIVSGGNDVWSVTKNDSDNQYVLTNSLLNTTVTVSLLDEKEIVLSNGLVNPIRICDFLHDYDEDGNKIGISFDFKYLTDDRTFVSGYKVFYDYTLGKTKYVDKDTWYSSSSDNIVTHVVSSEDISNGYITFNFNDTSLFYHIIVTDSTGAEKRWDFNYFGYYYGSDVETVSGKSWYVSDFTQNRYKIGKAMYTILQSNEDVVSLSGQKVSPIGFGSVELDTTNGSIEFYNNNGSNSIIANYMTFFNAGSSMSIPVSEGDTIKIYNYTNKPSIGGYGYSYIKTWILENYMNLLPFGLKSIITPAVKKTCFCGGSTIFKKVSSSLEKLWIFSAEELGFSDIYILGYDEGDLYPIFSNSGSRRKNNISGNSVPAYWTRTPTYSYANRNFYINYDSFNNMSSTSVANVSIGFTV